MILVDGSFVPFSDVQRSGGNLGNAAVPVIGVLAVDDSIGRKAGVPV